MTLTPFAMCAIMSLSRNTQERFFFSSRFAFHSCKPLQPSKLNRSPVFRDKKRPARLERFVMYGILWQDEAWPVEARRNCDMVRLCKARLGAVRHDKARMHYQLWSGCTRQGRAGCGAARYGGMRCGVAWQGCNHPFMVRHGSVRRGKARSVLVWPGIARHGKVRPVRTRCGTARIPPSFVMAWFGATGRDAVRRGVAWLGAIRLGKAWNPLHREGQ